MPRGKASVVGTVTINANGYSQTKTENGWRATHTLILEARIGRKLRAGESARFRDGDKSNLDPENIYLAEHSSTRSVQAKIAKLRAEVEDRLALIKDLEALLETNGE